MRSNLTRRLLAAGILAGPLALAIDFTLALSREGFELQRHASSQLALGDGGWMQSLNFVVAGLPLIWGPVSALAWALRRRT